jgi:hypothetical protein
MKNKVWQLLLLCLLLSPAAGYAWDHEVGGVSVGLIRTYGNAGVSTFRKADGSAFPGCSSDAASMWADSAYLTADGRKALLAVLLTARTTNSTIRVYYTTADGYCRFQVIDIE